MRGVGAETGAATQVGIGGTIRDKKTEEEEMPTGDAQTAIGTRHKKISLLQCGATADPAGSWSEHCRPRSGGPPDD